MFATEDEGGQVEPPDGTKGHSLSNSCLFRSFRLRWYFDVYLIWRGDLFYYKLAMLFAWQNLVKVTFVMSITLLQTSLNTIQVEFQNSQIEIKTEKIVGIIVWVRHIRSTVIPCHHKTSRNLHCIIWKPWGNKTS